MPKPKRSATKLVLKEYDAIPSGRWMDLSLMRIDVGDGLLTLVLEVVGHPDQLGRQIEHVLPALLRPGSTLTGWLAAAFGIRLTLNESIELADLVGRNTQAKFSKPDPNGAQQIIAWRPVSAAKPTAPSPESASRPTDSPASASSSMPATLAKSAGTAVTRTGVNPEKGEHND